MASFEVRGGGRGGSDQYAGTVPGASPGGTELPTTAALRCASSCQTVPVFIEVRDRLINTLCFGAGTQTLLAHGGFTGNYELWLQPFEILRRRHRTITYDHRGAGEHRRESQTPHGRSRRRRRRGR